MKRLLLLSLIPFASYASVACSGGTADAPPFIAGPSDTSTDGGDSGAPGSPGSDGSTPPPASAALKIVSLSTTSQTIVGGRPLQTESDSTTFVAIVTNTAGLDAIAGGELRDDQGNVYGAFGAGAEKGTYTSSASWATLRAIAAPSFGNGQGTRTFVARFFDNAGGSVDASIEVRLACRAGDDLIGSCGDGNCLDTRVEGTHCGTCGSVCGRGQFCNGGTCKLVGYTPNTGGADCTAVRAISTETTCEDICSAYGRTTEKTVRYFGTSSCNGSGGPGPASNLPIRAWNSLDAHFRCGCPGPL